MIVTLSLSFLKWCLHCLCYELSFVRFSWWYSCVSSLQFSNSSLSALYHSRSLFQLCHFTWYCSCFSHLKCLEFCISFISHSSWLFMTIGREGVCFYSDSGSVAAFWRRLAWNTSWISIVLGSSSWNALLTLVTILNGPNILLFSFFNGCWVLMFLEFKNTMSLTS